LGLPILYGKLGAKALDYAGSQMTVGDLIVLPENNTNVRDVKKDFIVPVGPALQVQPTTWISTMAPAVGAGFYSQRLGPLPYVIADVPPTTISSSASKPQVLAPDH